MTEILSHQTQLLRILGTCCESIDWLSKELKMSHRQISNAAAGLISKGYLERKELGCFQLTPQGLDAAKSGKEITSGPNGEHSVARSPLPDTLRQRAWNAIRMQRRFTIPDIVTVATRGGEANATNNLQRYCQALCKARVLRRLQKRSQGTALTSNGYVQYTLVNDLGRIAPSYRAKARALYDHNADQEICCD